MLYHTMNKTLKSMTSGLIFWLRGKDLNQRPPGYEPDELPAALPRDIKLPNFSNKVGAGDRGRTGTSRKAHGILSPGRLPIPPLRQIGSKSGARTHNLSVNSRLLYH